tara:strand:- start:177 stop:749 length:573 start_codon:yes stop_codon:yes gene_type:complete
LKKIVKSLTIEEKEIWRNYVDNFSDTNDKSSATVNTGIVKASSAKESQINRDRINKIKSKSSKLSISLDKKVFIKLKNGKLKPERTLDLHGYSYQKAFTEVIAFIKLAYRDKKRLILIITGKGSNLSESENYFLENHRGVLRKAFPNWLENKGLRPLILNVTSAHYTHGGDGAYYVYLKKNSQNIPTQIY